MVNAYCVCYIYSKDTLKFKKIKKAKECFLCKKFVCNNCIKSIENFFLVEDKYTNKNTTTICVCCIANLLFKTKNFDTNLFIKKIKKITEIDEEIINKNENCLSCNNFKKNFNLTNFMVCYIPLYKSFVVKKKIENDLLDSQNDTKEKLIKVSEKCFDETCFYCLIKIFNLDHNNAKFTNIILTRFNKIKNVFFENFKMQDSDFSYCYQRKNIISILKKNIKVNIVILEKKNPNDKENYENTYKKYFLFSQLKEIDDIKKIFLNKQQKYEIDIEKKISNVFVRTESMYIKNILEYISGTEIDLTKYKFYIQYDLRDESLSSYLIDINNYKNNIDNLTMYENIFTIQTNNKIKDRIREEIKKHKYKYAVTLDIKHAYYNVLLNSENLFVELNKMYDDNIIVQLIDYFNKINVNKKNNFLPITSLSHHIFKNFMYNIFMEYKKENILIMCDDIIILSHTFQNLKENFKEILNLLIVKNKLIVNFNKVKFYNLEKQNLFFTNTCIYPSKNFKNIIIKWISVLYKPDSSIYFKKSKEEFYKLYLMNKKEEEKKQIQKNILKEELNYLKKNQNENKQKKNKLNSVIELNKKLIKEKTYMLKELKM